MLTWQNYDFVVAIWSMLGFFSEILEGNPLLTIRHSYGHYMQLLFKSNVNQFSIITELLDTSLDDIRPSENLCRRSLLITDRKEPRVCVILYTLAQKI